MTRDISEPVPSKLLDFDFDAPRHKYDTLKQHKHAYTLTYNPIVAFQLLTKHRSVVSLFGTMAAGCAASSGSAAVCRRLQHEVGSVPVLGGPERLTTN